jgi:tetratricopeptide (TPR) repeat protein
MNGPAADVRSAVGPVRFTDLRAGGNVTIGPVTVNDTSAIAAEARAARDRIEDLAGQLKVSRNSVYTFLKKIGDADVPDGDEGVKLIEVATRYKILEKQTELLKAADPQMQWIRAEVEFALARGDFDFAEALLASAVSQIKGVEHLRDGNIAKALELLQQSVTALEPYIKSKPNYSRLVLQIGYILKTQGDALYQGKDNDRAESVLNEALARFYTVVREIPSNQKTVADLAGALNGIANISYIRGDAEGAITWGEIATTLEPSYAYAWHDLLGALIVLAQRGDVRLEKMRGALERLRATGMGLPGLAPAYLDSLERSVQAFVPASGG